MKRFLLALAAVAAITVGSSFTNSAMAHGPGYGYGHGHHHNHCGPRYGSGYGGYGSGYNVYRPSYGYGGYGPGYRYGNPYNYGNHGVIQLYGPRGGFTFGY